MGIKLEDDLDNNLENKIENKIEVMSDIVVRLAQPEDMKRLCEIYAYYVEETNVSFEYEAPSVEEFTKRYENIIMKYPYLVAEIEGEIVGYSYANTFKARTAYSWCVETTIYLDKECAGRGAGRALYTTLERYLVRQNIKNLYAGIVNPYPLSEEFHGRMGFKQVALFEKCGYKFGKWQNMTWMEKVIGDKEDLVDDVIWFPNIIND